MSKHSDKYNALSFEIRTICQPVFLEDQIRDLKIEKQRAIRYHKMHLNHINEHLKNCEHVLFEITNSKDGGDDG